MRPLASAAQATVQRVRAIPTQQWSGVPSPLTVVLVVCSQGVNEALRQLRPVKAAIEVVQDVVAVVVGAAVVKAGQAVVGAAARAGSSAAKLLNG